MIAKKEIRNLSAWVNKLQAFVTDERGVVLIAHDRTLEMKSLPGSSIDQLDETHRIGYYNRSQFDRLEIAPWNDRGTALVRFERSAVPAVMASCPVPNSNFTISAVGGMGGLSAIRSDCLCKNFSLQASNGKDKELLG